MNNPLIAKKLESLNHCLERLETKRPDSVRELITNFDLQDILSVNLERAVQISVDIAAILISEKKLKSPNSMAGSFKILEEAQILDEELSMKMQQSVGFRNVSVHEYRSIDWNIVFDVVHNHLGNFKQFMKAALKGL